MKDFVKVSVMALLLSFVGCASSPDAMSGATPHGKMELPEPGDSYEVIGKVQGIKKFVVRYDNGIVRGGEFLSEEGMKRIRDMKVKTIVSVTPTSLEEELCKKYGITLVKMPFAKEKGPLSQEIGLFLQAVKGASPV